MSAKLPRPEPVVVTTICSLCDEPWEAHGDAPTTLDCIRLLKAKAAASKTIVYQDRWWPQPYPIQPTVRPYTPYWQYPNQGTIVQASGTVSGSLGTTTQNVVQFKRPDDPPDDAVPARVG